MLNASIDPDDREVFDELAAGHRIIGSASYGHFPLFHEAYGGKRGEDPREGWERPEVLACEAWAHCFREPDQYLPPGKPRMLVSTSDFVEIAVSGRWVAAIVLRPNAGTSSTHACPIGSTR